LCLRLRGTDIIAQVTSFVKSRSWRKRFSSTVSISTSLLRWSRKRSSTRISPQQTEIQSAWHPVGLLDDIRLYWGIPQPDLSAAQPATPPPEPAQTEDPSSSPQPTRRVDRSMNLGTAQAVAEAKRLMTAKGLTKTAACELVGLDRRTYNRWCDHEAVNSLLEDMQDHRPPDQ
jgi:hypothetical protein